MAGPWEKYGAQQGQVVTLPPDPLQQAAAAREEARLRLAQDAAARASANAPSLNERALREQLLAAQVESAKAAAAKAKQGTAGSNVGDAKTQQRRANLDALGNQLAHVRSLWERNLKGGAPNWIAGNVPDGLRPENGAFESAAAGLGEIGLAAFRVPGIGSQSDAELRQFVNANTPQPGDSDAKIAEKLHNLENRLNSTRKAMGIAEPDAETRDQLTTGAGFVRDPAKKGLEAEYRRRLAAGASAPALVKWLKGAGVDVNEADVAAQVRYRKENPKVPIGQYPTQIEMTPAGGAGLVGKIADSPLGAYGVSAANAFSLGLLDEMAPNQQAAQFNKDVLREQNPGASLLGDISGSALGMTGLNAGLRGLGGKLSALATRGGGIGGDALYGAAFGAGEQNDDRLSGGLTGAGAAGLGNFVGRGLVSGAGRAVRGVSSPEVQALNARGVSMTPGQIAGQGGVLGRGYRALEDAIESVPVLGSAVRSRKIEGVQDFNREAFKDALAPINQQVGAIGPEGIGEAQDLVSNAYGSALNGARIRADIPFVQQAGQAVRAGRAVPKVGDEFDYTVRNEIGPLFGPGRSLDGAGFQEALQTAQGAASDFARQGTRTSGAAAEQMRNLRQAFTDLAGRQSPATMPALSAANAANRNVSILGDAVTAAKNNSADLGLFAPSQLNNAATANTKKFGGKRAAARGDVPFRDLIGAGQAVLPNVVPNSGTTDRALANLVLPATLGGSAYGANELGAPTPVVTTLGLLGAASTKKGNQAIQKLLVSRDPVMRDVGEKLLRWSRIGGMFGASSALPALNQ